MNLPCESVITHVNVYARGALVTRRVTVPAALPAGPVALTVDGVTGLAEPAGVRAVVPDGCDRALLAVRAVTAVPAPGATKGEATVRLRDAERRLRDVTREQNHLRELRGHLERLRLDPALRARDTARPHRDAASRAADALAADALLDRLLARLDVRDADLDAAEDDARRALSAASLAVAQADTAAREGAQRPTLSLVVELSDGGSVPFLDVTYSVTAARWWPVYALRLRDGGRRATWIAEALVAQRSGEDWRDAALSLSTADLLVDARLPELASLRFGRAQAPAPRGYREAPAGLDEMFRGYDRAFVDATPPARSEAPVMSDLLLAQSLAADEEVEAEAGYGAPQELAREVMPQAKRRAMPVQNAPTPAAPPKAAMSAPAMRGGGGLFGASLSLDMGPGGAAPPPPEPLPVEPADAWLDYDALGLADATEHGLRGRLHRRDDDDRGRRAALDAIESLEGPLHTRDPRVSRGLFDHRYEVGGRADVRSDGQLHRVPVATAEAEPTLRWRTTPAEGSEVFREAELRNPFDAPLLAGPVDVFLDGAALTVSPMDRIDRGGTMHVGMGVDPRLRVARNVRAREETAGLLGGDTVVHHEVAIELTSSLSQSALVEVLDRVPVTDDRAVEITLVRSAPEHERYTQSERGSAVRGGLRWRVIVPAGARQSVEFAYRVTFASKHELVGGNRRG